MKDNPVLLASFDILHQLSTIAWIGGIMFSFLVVMPTIRKELDPAGAGKFSASMFKRVRVVVYTSLLILFVTGIPMKIVSPYFVSIINFDNTWEIVLFVKHVLVAFMALGAFYSFEILAPKIKKLMQAKQLDQIPALRKQQGVLGALAFVLGITVVVLSVVMNYL